jgi:hypothetical protein
MRNAHRKTRVFRRVPSGKLVLGPGVPLSDEGCRDLQKEGGAAGATSVDRPGCQTGPLTGSKRAPPIGRGAET